jgi:hypothetical protein
MYGRNWAKILFTYFDAHYSKGHCHGVKTMTGIDVHGSVRVCVFGGLGGIKNTRITKWMQRFILVWAIGALCPAVDDPTDCKNERERFGRG